MLSGFRRPDNDPVLVSSFSMSDIDGRADFRKRIGLLALLLSFLCPAGDLDEAAALAAAAKITVGSDFLLNAFIASVVFLSVDI